MSHAELHLRSSMVHWWPAVQQSGVPAPQTILVPCDDDALYDVLEPSPDTLARRNALIEALDQAAQQLGGYPVFLRTDLVSGKHSYAHACYVPSRSPLPRHLWRVFDAHASADIIGLPLQAVAVRELLPVEPAFYAFDDLPITAERRYFIRDGRVVCHHPYWPESAFHRPYLRVQRLNGPSGTALHARDAGDWRWRLAQVNVETPQEIEELTRYAEAVGRRLPGYWSVDFLRSRRGWFLIDMAAGEASWHPPCPFRAKEQEDAHAPAT